MKKTLQVLLSLYTLLFMLPPCQAASDDDGHWVGTWATAPQLVESHNNPPSPGLKNNQLRQIFQLSIGGDSARLKLTNEFSTSATEIVGVELAIAATAGNRPDIDEGSTVSLTFGGSPSVTMAVGQKVTSDPIAFHLEPRQNVAVTIRYGNASSTSVTGHPGSRTTSYLKTASASSFTSATKTEHWYSLLALEVKAPAVSGCVSILGNSITDGRGSTPNGQNRWPDVLSRRLLDNPATSHVGVLNMGIGGNCMLSGGLGPTGSSRWQRDLLEQEGVRWIILFEAVNDLGSASNGTQTAQRIIDVYKEIIRAAHERGIYVFGATITPFKGNNYYSTDHEKGRKTLNTWIRTTQMLDGVIDFDKAVRNPSDTLSLQSQYLFENDHLHLNAAGYEAMANAIDLSLFTKTGPVAANDDAPTPGETFSSNLPLIYIRTSSTINADSKVAGTMRIIDNAEGRRNCESDTTYDYNGPIGIKLRGNSSLNFAQKKYTLETWDDEGNDVKVSLLGLPAESDWVLLAPYNDLSLVRDVFAYNLWTEMGHWGPRTRMCEVFVNDEYLGVYVFCEKIKRDKNRVDIAKMKNEDVADRELTGGYIVRVDAYDQDDVTFKSKVAGIQSSYWGGSGTGTVTWTIFYPKKEDLQPEQKAYIQNYVDQMEQSFQQSNFKDSVEGYARWIDVPSFVDYFIHTELSLNADGYKRSSYFFKDKDKADGTLSRMEAGPVWDYNLAYGDCNFCNANNVRAWVYNGCETNPTPALWKKLTQDPAFMQKVRERYAQLRRTVISRQRINTFFDDYAALLDEAKDRHYAKYDNLFQSGNQGGWPWWGGSSSPISYFAAYYVASYDEEIQTVKEWFGKRLDFLDSQWKFDESLPMPTLTDDSHFSIDVERGNERLDILANRPLRSVAVYSLAGHLLISGLPQDDDGRRVSLSLPRWQHSQPVIVVCEAADDAYITRKVR
jgi:lysophospholipase L1-like esterase